MKITRIAQENQESEWANIISKEECEDMLQRVFNGQRQYFDENGPKTWQEWLQNESDYEISLLAESDYNIYSLYFSNLPEEITAIDIVNAYRNGKLPSKQFIQQIKRDKLAIEHSDVGERNLPWQSKPVNNLSRTEAQDLYNQATQRVTKNNKDVVMQARKELFIAYNTDSSLASKIGISESELNKKIRSQTGFSVSAKKMQEGLNRDIPEEHQWTGISNSSFINTADIDTGDLDNFVKQIDVPESSQGFYNSFQGEAMRKYIMSTFLGIDTRLDYKDLSFELGEAISPTGKPVNGLYSGSTNKITISNLEQGTISHEIGHFIDHKFARDYIPSTARGLAGDDIMTSRNESLASRIPEEHLAWLDKYYEFTTGLMKKGNISSQYYQEPGETFARFIDHFVKWTTQQAGAKHYYGDDYRYSKDKFTQQDFTFFVRLLQEKSFLDSKFPLT